MTFQHYRSYDLYPTEALHSFAIWPCRLGCRLRAILDDDSQYPAIRQEKGQRSSPQTREERANSQKLEVVPLMQPCSLRGHPQAQC